MLNSQMSNVEALQSKCTAYSISEIKMKLQKSSVNLSPLMFAALFPYNPTSQRIPPPQPERTPLTHLNQLSHSKR